MWAITDYEQNASEMARKFVESAGQNTINDQAVKLAMDAQLNPDGVRTLVRLANVHIFENMMAKAAENGAKDRMFEFETGDPEAVLTQLHSTAKVASVVRQEPSSDDRIIDFFSDVAVPEPLEKVASPVVMEEKPAPLSVNEHRELLTRFEKAAEKLRSERLEAQMVWYGEMEKAAAHLQATDSRSEFRVRLEKDAVAHFGETVVPELRMLQRLTGTPLEVQVCGGEKVATVLTHHIPDPRVVRTQEQPILEAIKVAHSARKKSHLCASGLEWLSKHLSK